MKKSFGIMLFIIGTIHFYLSMNQVNYNDTTGTFAAIRGNEILLPYILFCIMGVSVLMICVYEANFSK